MTESLDLTVDLDKLSGLARQFAELEMYREAEELFGLAIRFDPHNRGLQLALANIRQQLKQEILAREDDAENAVREKFRRNAIDACHFFGLAALYRDRGKPQLAKECLEIALEKEPVHPYAFKLQGRLLFEKRDYDGARAALRTSRRYNPFDRKTAELLGRVEYEREQYRSALAATIDSFLLLTDEDRGDAEELKRRIRELKKLVKLDGDETMRLFHERQQRLQTNFDRLELQRERFLHERAERKDRAEAEDAESGRLMLAMKLRHFEIWSRLNDEHVFQLTRVAERVSYAGGEQIFAFEDDGHDLFLIERGEVVIRRPTAYGDFELARLQAGSLLGEVNFISRVRRSGEAVADGGVEIVRLGALELETLMEERPDLGVKIYSSFWQGLAIKLRGANEQLRTFFESAEDDERLEKLRQAVQGDSVDGASSDTVALLREQGLSGNELQTLANFSNVKRYPGGTYLFHEGDPGDEMYVVLEGKVMISKFIPGGGEEALAILERGDFFGEMSLIDGAPRSADAKAFRGPATVVAFDQQTLREVELVDPRASIDFIRLLCQLMCQRLREIDEKVTAWRIMSGHRPNEEADLSLEFPPGLAGVAQG